MIFSFIKEIFNRCVEIIVRPKEEWKRIKEESLTVFQLFRDFLFPLIAVSVVSSMIGSYIKMTETVFDSHVLILEGLREFLSLMTSLILSIFIVNELIKTYGGEKNIDIAANLVTYSYVPILLVSILLGLSSSLFILGLFSLYLFYIFFQGTPVMLNLPDEKQSNFSILSAMTILMIYLMVSFIIYSVFKTFLLEAV